MANTATHEDFQRLAAAARQRILELTPEEARVQQARGAVLIDVRDSEELAEKPGIPGALNISRGRLELRIADAVPDKHAILILYCQGGNRGALAADSLRQMGYGNVFNLAGGANAWFDQQKETSK
jgi:rhodanese-related sulfurtransferase